MNLKKPAFLIISGLLLLFLFYSRFDLGKIFGFFTQSNPLILAAYLGVVFLIDLLLVVRWKIILDAQNIYIPFRRLFFYKQSAYAVGYVTPQMHIGDSSTRLLLLKKHNVDTKAGLTTILIDRAMSISTDAILAIIGLTVIGINFALTENMRMIMMLVALCIGSFLGILYYRVLAGKSFISPIFRVFRFRNMYSDTKELERNIHLFFRMHRAVFGVTVIINILLWALMFTEYKLAFLLLGYSAKFLEIFLVISIVGIAYAMPVPFAFGVLEAGQMSVVSLLGIDSLLGLGISMLIRAKDMVRTVIGLSALSFFSAKWSSENTQRIAWSKH